VTGVRGRRLTAIIAAGLLALAGCGGGDSLAPEVPGPPADVVLPESTVAPAADEDADATDEDSTTDEGTTDEGTTDEGTTPEDTGATGDTGAAAPDTSGGGTAAPDAEADSPTNDTPPPEDSEAEQFEDFCAQNPGAC
jgi:hypothetical protein